MDKLNKNGKSLLQTKKIKLVVVGGGTGTFTVLTGLKKHPQLDLSVIVSMMDDGGSNRVIRDEFGLLPTSDIRQCIVALSEENPGDLLRKLFTYRFNAGTGIAGNPATREKVTISAVTADGVEVHGEENIDLGKYNGSRTLRQVLLKPDNPQLSEGVIEALERADVIIAGPGDLYTSILPNVVVPGISEALKNSRAKKIFVLNLMTKYGQTDRFTTGKFLSELEKYAGEGVIDYCLTNKSKDFPKGILERYEAEKAYLVKDDLVESEKLRIVRSDFISSEVYEKSLSDKIKRSLIRHDPDKLARAIMSIING
ncbi:MAG: Transporter [Candidatus Woesebacteria bacterium GW2011_GWB1_38_5]|uniref:Transporter n=1 Tax=Candidatus Woesebacteria bacterium GW2011_GWB1_38_5 TaxID=1618568 RepID=A0A0G0MNA4_9BACT|nr:MAG: Transporter [Candidatus Woesebacteria bacterium GW2011_GWB1_38_5]